MRLGDVRGAGGAGRRCAPSTRPSAVPVAPVGRAATTTGSAVTAGGAWAGGSSGRCRPAGDHQYERDGPRSKRTLRASAAGQSLTRSVLGAPSPSDPRSRSCCRLTREDYGYPCSIVEVERRTSALPLRHAWMPRHERDDEYRCCRCDWVDPSVRPSARMSRHRAPRDRPLDAPPPPGRPFGAPALAFPAPPLVFDRADGARRSGREESAGMGRA